MSHSPSGVGWCQSASQVVLHYRFGIAVGSEHLSGVLDLLPSLSFFTHLLSPDSQTLHNTEEGPRTETLRNPVKLIRRYKLNNLPVHHHTAMNLYRYTVRLTMKFPSDACTHRYGNGHLTYAGTSIRQKWVWESDGNGYGLYYGYVGYAKNAVAYLQMAPLCQFIE